MQVQVNKEDKKEAVKTKMPNFEETLPIRECYFSPDHRISPTQATITEAKFGFPLCPFCVLKVGEIVQYVVELNFK